MLDMTVTLRPMTVDEFDRFIEPSLASFVAEMVNQGQIPAEDAPAEIKRRRQQHLPDGLDTEHMALFVGEVEGVAIGWLWLALPGAPNHVDTAWVYNVEVDPAHRGKGYGRGLMLAAEAELVHRGVTKLGLNVFGGNTTAMRLYESLGYKVISQQMSKPLGG
jgi:ribosomal protein S18 acetylase RimI-like enzyme